MVGRIRIDGTSTGTGGANPFVWSNNANQGLTQGEAEGVTVDLATGVFTISAGYGGQWYFDFSFSCVGSNSTTQTYQIVGDPLGTPVVLFQRQRRLNTGADVGAASVSGLVTVAAGDTFAARLSGDTNGEFTLANMIAFQISNDQ